MREDMKFRSAVNGFNKADVMSCIEKLMNENAQQKQKIKELEDQLIVCQTSLSEAKTESENKDMCAKCDAAKVAQAQLGAAMLDAKRFSEMLMKDANDKSAQVLNKAMQDVGISMDTANELAEELKKTKDNFVSVLDNLSDELSVIILSFMEFRSDLNNKGLQYNFTTDFADTSEGESK